MKPADAGVRARAEAAGLVRVERTDETAWVTAGGDDVVWCCHWMRLVLINMAPMWHWSPPHAGVSVECFDTEDEALAALLDWSDAVLR